MIPDTPARATRSPTARTDVESHRPPATSRALPSSGSSPADAAPAVGFPLGAAASGGNRYPTYAAAAAASGTGGIHLPFALLVTPSSKCSTAVGSRRHPTTSRVPTGTPPSNGSSPAAAASGNRSTTYAAAAALGTGACNLQSASSASPLFFSTTSPGIGSHTATGSPLAAPPFVLPSGTTAHSGIVSTPPAVLTSTAAVVAAGTPTVNLPFGRTKTSTSTAPNVSRPGRINDDIQEILEDSDPEEYIDAKTELEMKGNTYKCLVAMTIGSKDDSGLDIVNLEKEPFKSYHLHRNLRPDKTAYWNEVMRRHNIKKLVPRDRIGRSLTNEQYIELLEQNPIVQPSCVEFLRKKIKEMKSDIEYVTRRESSTVAEQRGPISLDSCLS